MKVRQMGGVTVYKADDFGCDDVMVIPNPTPSGGTIIFIASLFMDRASVLHVQTITETELRALENTASDNEAFQAVLDGLWRKDE